MAEGARLESGVYGNLIAGSQILANLTLARSAGAPQGGRKLSVSIHPALGRFGTMPMAA